MLGWLSNIWALHWGSIIGAFGLVSAVALMWHQQRIHAGERRRDKRIREEFEAYARLDASLHGDEDVPELARRVCRLVAKKSAFQRVALLAQNAEGRLYVAGSVGMEEGVIGALHAWGQRAVEEGATPENDRAGIRVGEKSFAVVLGKESAEGGCGRAIIVPLWTASRQMAGALAVCADSLMTWRRHTVGETIPPLEALAVKLARAMENATLAKRLLQTEKLAGLGLLASGVAQALSHPLTAVAGLAELIEETAKETRVRRDAELIVQEAQRMRQTVQDLVNFGQSGPRIDEPVKISALVQELAAECEERLQGRDIQLTIETEDVPAMRGNGDRLRQVLEHLLNNAAQAIASTSGDIKREHEIRVSVSRDASSVQIIVSDTGSGFREPERVFDPFHPARQPGEGAGVGLSICYGIVREHGGEISAFNLHPYGAAVMVELPFGKSTVQELSSMVREVA